MNSVLWHQQGNDYQASILDYNAIITEIPNKQAYAARIESKEGKALREPFDYLMISRKLNHGYCLRLLT